MRDGCGGERGEGEDDEWGGKELMEEGQRLASELWDPVREGRDRDLARVRVTRDVESLEMAEDDPIQRKCSLEDSHTIFCDEINTNFELLNSELSNWRKRAVSHTTTDRPSNK